MTTTFSGDCRATLIGSMPLRDHEAAAALVRTHTPEIPVWVQLPKVSGEGMIEQFIAGMPGVKEDGGRHFVDTGDDGFSDALVAFYERYLSLESAGFEAGLDDFALDPRTAPGFYALERMLPQWPAPLAAVKGQVTGPITFATAVKDQRGQAIFYDPQLRDAAVKLLGACARWQVARLRRCGAPVIVFIDEPGLAGFGTSEFISMTREDVSSALDEVISAIHDAGGLAGIHVCANTDWSLVLESAVDIANFDAYAYLDRFLLYGDAVRRFLGSGRHLAWGLVPTLEVGDILRESVPSLVSRFLSGVERIEALGPTRRQVLRQSIITPSCGVGALDPETALRVLTLTRDLSAALRALP